MMRIVLSMIGLASGFGAVAAWAQDAKGWPDKPVHIVVPLTAGSATDVMAYDTRRDLMGVTPLGLLPQALVISPAKGIDSVQKLTEVMAGRVDYYFCPVNVRVPMIREKRLLARRHRWSSRMRIIYN